MVERPGRPMAAGSQPADVRSALMAATLLPWILRTNRVLSAEWGPSSLEAFARAFHGGAWPRPIDASKVSRWETSRLRVPRDAVRRYEELLGMDRGVLTGLVDALEWFSLTEGGSKSFDVGRRRRREQLAQGPTMIEVWERATSDSPISAHEWEVFSQVAAHAGPRALTESQWEDLLNRLSRETVLASNTLWLSRYASLGRLLSHPVGGRLGARILHDLACDPAEMMAAEHAGALEAVRSEAGAELLVNLVANAPSDEAYYGALTAIPRMTRANQLGSSHRRVLRSVLWEQLRHDQSAFADQTLTHHVLQLLSDDPDGRPAAPSDRAPMAHRDAALVRRLGARTEIDAGDTRPPNADGFLPMLIAEAILSPLPDHRMYAAHILAVTPYKAPLARAVTHEISTHIDWRRCHRLEDLLYSLRFIGHAGVRDLLEHRLLDAHTPLKAQVMCARVIGHVDGHSSPAFWMNALTTYGAFTAPPTPTAARQPRTPSPDVDAILNRLVYSLGVQHETPLLQAIARNHQTREPIRQAASWWATRPLPLVHSAQL